MHFYCTYPVDCTGRGYLIWLYLAERRLDRRRLLSGDVQPVRVAGDLRDGVLLHSVGLALFEQATYGVNM